MIGNHLAVSKEILSNGLTLIELDQPYLHTVAMSVYVKTGSRFESSAQNGISHFLEHMIFRGTQMYPTAFELNLAFEHLGANVIGCTTPDSTEYTVTLPAASAKEGFGLLCQMVTSPHFNEIDTERKIIAEEILEDFDEHNKCIDIDTLSRERIWDKSALGASITGTVHNIMQQGYRELDQWFLQNYVASNMVVCVSGKISTPAFRRHIREILEPIPAGTRNYISPHPQSNSSNNYLHVNKPGSQTQLRLAFKTIGLNHLNYPAVETLLRLIDDGMSTPLHRRIFEDKALAYNIGASLEAYEETGVLNIDAQASHDNILEITVESLQIIQDIKLGHFSKGDFSKAQKRAIWDLESLTDYPGALNSWYGEQELYRNAVHPAEAAQQINILTKTDIVNMAAKIFQNNQLFVTTVGLQSSVQQQKLKAITITNPL